MSSEVWSIIAIITTAVVALVLAVFAFAVLVLIIRGKIKIENLLAESDGKASFSRFQFLLFTFVIAGLYFILCVESGTLLDVPASVLGILGISAGGYVTSKMVSAGKEAVIARAGIPTDNALQIKTETKELTTIHPKS